MAKQPRLRYGMPERWAVEWGEDQHGMFMGFGVGEVVQRLRYIPPGRFLMGSPEGELGRWEDEGPQHVVELSEGYWLADTPCTQALWEAVMGQNPSEFVDPKNPVETVSWDDCQEFVRRLNEQVPGLHARLPSEAEWEYACRGGTSGATWVDELDGERTATVLDPIAWYDGNSEDRTHPVGSKAANPFGLYDMLGNVWEWCEDRGGLYGAAAVMDPRGPSEGSSRVFRGGSWGSDARRVRAAYRGSAPPGDQLDNLGFRLARSQTGQTRRASPEKPVGGAAGRGAAGARQPRLERLSRRHARGRTQLARRRP